MENFRTLTRISLPLGPLNVLVGPNAVGKSNVLHMFDFLATVSRDGVERAVSDSGGFEELAFRGGRRRRATLRVGIEGVWTDHASPSTPDQYSLTLLNRLTADGEYGLSRREFFEQRAEAEEPSTVQLSQEGLHFSGPGERPVEPLRVGRYETGLHSRLPGLPDCPSKKAVRDFVDSLSSVRTFDVDVRAARRDSPIGFLGVRLDDDAANLADFLNELQRDEDAWESLLKDVRTIIPQIEDIVVRPSSVDRVKISLKERGLRGLTSLKDASFGTVRLLSLLALFHDPHPPALTCIEEIDHGIHPHGLELLAHRIREASDRTQFLVTTHSPVFVNQMTPEEIVICERSEDGSSRVPAIDTETIHEIIEASEGLPPGDLWFSGSLGGDL
ncbi:AAA family ATPase [Streptomyces sulphureus]|uniref:AAA family ATPase n=1 Tax=Streptomyces sulphureus TaxID=47758 RepID=UPI00039C29F8|nr:AAA family ATPase [Streptomyces sulphureus]